MEQDNTRINQLFDQSRSASPAVSFEETKLHFLNSVGALNSTSLQGITRFLTFKNVLIMTLFSIILIGTAVFFNDAPELETAPTFEISSKIEQLKEKGERILVQENQTISITDRKQQEKLNPKKKDVVAFYPDSNNFENGIYEVNKLLLDVPKMEEMEVQETKQVLVLDSVFKFPVLTPEQIKENNKRKLAFRGISNKHLIPYGYLFIPKEKVYTKKYSKNADPYFLMKQTEVSNIQYKTFLFDLLIQNRKEDFLLAKPDQTQWRKTDPEYAAYMEANYFSNKIYDEHPVVNVSRKGAEMYCEWLSDEINQSQTKKLKEKKLRVRLPSAEEWVHAALAGENNSYGFGGSINRQNESGCFLANFRYSSETDVIPFTGCEIKDYNAHTTSGLILGKGNFASKIYSYNPNNYGLFCMSGNVAEMVTYSNGIGTKGGSWNSIGENIKIKAVAEYMGVESANVSIGFRPVIVTE
ncbi:MAG: SUMF1/EgtB/PvdO family nonheme iron enzyme [Flavobacteriales bacterium]|nr:SUMF1/EgtB/PvdO family nonheme iron enzyme [Flavobacteriales bacterium]